MDFETRFYSAGIPLAATVHIPDQNNDRLAGRELVKVPDGIACSTQKYPMVILCHGHARFRNDGLDGLARALGASGIASLRFDHRGCGKDAVNRYRLRPATEMPYDTKCAIDFCESLPFVDRGRIGISGVSMGGVMSIITAASDPRIKSAAPMAAPADCSTGIISGWGDKAEEVMEILREDARINAATGCSRVINRMNDLAQAQGAEVADANILEALMIPGDNAYTTLESMQNLMQYVAMDYVEDVRCPIFVIHGEDDELIPVADARQIYAGLPADNPKKVLKIYKDVDHNIPICGNRDIVFRDIVAWFLETL